MKNKYVNRSKVSEAKFRQLIRYFSLDLTAIQITELTGLNRNTVNRYLTEIRKKILIFSIATSPLTDKKFPPFDTNNFNDFCILVREFEEKIYTKIIPTEMVYNSENSLKLTFLQESGFDLIINPQTGNHTFLRKKVTDNNQYRKKINRIESFWGNAKSRLAKFKGMHSSTIRYHVKECEFRFNNRNKDLYQLLLKILRNDPLF